MVCIQKKFKLKTDAWSFPDVYIEPCSYKLWKLFILVLLVTQKTSNATYPASQSASELYLIDANFIFPNQFYYSVLLEVHFFPCWL